MVWPPRFGFQGGAGRIHFRHAASPRCDASRDAGYAGEMVAGAVDPQEYRGARRRLVELLQDQGIKDLSVLHAIDAVQRHLFVPTGVRHRAYEDSALPIGNGQTISQPSIHARYLELLKLKGNEKVLEIGTGSGLSLIHISEPTRLGMISYAVFCLKKKKTQKKLTY